MEERARCMLITFFSPLLQESKMLQQRPEDGRRRPVVIPQEMCCYEKDIPPHKNLVFSWPRMGSCPTETLCVSHCPALVIQLFL